MKFLITNIKIVLLILLSISNISLANDKLQAIFSGGMKYSTSGKYLSAAQEFRKMLAVDPSLIRPRLELAMVLYNSSDYEGAEYHFNRILSSDIPTTVRANVNALLSKIKQELPVINLSINLVSDTNPNQETSANTVNIGGLEFKLNGSSEDKHQNGYQFVANTKIPISSMYKSFVKANLQHTDYPGSGNSQSYITTSLGKHYGLGGSSTLTPEIGFHQSIYKDSRLYNGKTLSLEYFRPINHSTSAQIDLNSLEIKYPDYEHLSGWQHTLSSSIVKVSSPDNKWEFQASYLKSNQDDKTSAFNQPGISVKSTKEWKNGWTLGATIKLDRKTYQQADPFFGRIRKDKEKSVEITVLNRLFQFDDISPRLHIGRIENNSNMNLYEFNRSYLKLEFTREF